MHSDAFISGKASLRWPFLFLLWIVPVMVPPLHAREMEIISHGDSGEYISRIQFNAAELERVWETAEAFASRLKFPEKVDNRADIDDLKQTINARFGFYLYQQTAFLKQVDGVIQAELEIIFEGDRVTAAVRNVRFIDYARDRYGKFSPRSSKKYALEDLREKRNDEIWQGHFTTIDENMMMLLSDLEKSILEINEASNR
ncbi:MAG: hypothetical protein KFF73_16150 [Cyclobacteriaceae bacterium]|nr:hypothetical protein [Cyclobacteriaceae bacterium]